MPRLTERRMPLKSSIITNRQSSSKASSIFAIDFSGTVLAHPYRPNLVGKNEIGLNDTNGVPFFKNMANAALEGNGTVYYVFANPAHNKKPELKLTYVEKVDNAWWLGVGIYAQ